ncbi:MAG: response regulator [Acidobacteriia bacterium]|nr:response regulator [Terriglobia bacterium]
MGARPQAGWQYGLEFLADAPIACHELDLQGTLVRVNQAVCRLLALPEDQILGRKAWDFVRAEERDDSREALMRVLAGAPPPVPRERGLLRGDGSPIHVEIYSHHLRDGARVTGLRSFLLDITLRQQAEEALRKIQEGLEIRIHERTQELEQANQSLRREMEERAKREEEHRKLEAQVQHAQRLESLGILAGGIAHDFNNLLASIMGYASLAAMDLPDDSRARKSLDQVLIAARSAADLTQQMLAYSGRGTFVVDLLNVTQLIEGVVRLLETTLSKKAALRLNLAADLPPIQGDASQIRQVVMNLITNASESLAENRGLVQVTTGLQWAEAGELPALDPARILPEGRYVFLEVADTGCGMDQETLSKIFDPFFTTKFTGRGLGLAAVLGIIRSHHGSIRVNSEPGAGTTFRVMFPAAEGAASFELEQIGEEVAWRSDGLVLVVDDQPAVRNLARTVLEMAGLRVLTAGDGHEAVTVFTEHSREIHAVLLDLSMPGMDGGEVFRHLTELVPDIRVVLCSGYNEQDVHTKLGGHKPAGFLRKPYHPSELVERMRTVW